MAGMDEPEEPLEPIRGERRKKVYCAGPMFSPAEKWEQKRIGWHLQKANYEIFLPQRDGIELKSMMDYLVAKPEVMREVMIFTPILRSAVFALDFYMVLQWCDAIVFNMNGRMPDDGGIVEATGAYVAGKAVVLYKETPVSFIGGDDNPMIDGLARFVNVQTKTGIPEAVGEALTVTKSHNAGWAYEPPPQIRNEMELGRMVWEVRLAMEPTRDGRHGWTASIADLIAKLPDLCSRPADIQVRGDGTVELPGLKLGVLPVVDRNMETNVATLWKEFRKGVRAAMGLPEEP
jgi:nucleoside 2-deoxyribosyltransferase